ncbi:glycoside hydrolase family 28 protein [uncultured Draconibacterium sp.]|uniref:glycoside hydrolase family 28 protein n=1 Tax=uncultured Draconibacterium sp. TaxID=1573823 RepID=UPI0032176E28
MNTKTISQLLAIITLFCTGCGQQAETTLSGTTLSFNNIEFEMPAIPEPIIPDNVVNLTDFGAVGGGQVLNTKAFADAIDAVSEKGGGKIIIPAGIWLTGPIILKSNLELYTEEGALVLFSRNKDLYPLVSTSFEGLETWRCISPIYGTNLENIAFTGKGVWDGSGDAWRAVKRSKLTDSQWKKFVESGGVVSDDQRIWYPSEQFKLGYEGSGDQNVRDDLKTKEDFEAIRDYLRPVMLSIQNSKNVMLDGPAFQNSPAWCLHPLMVENLIVRNVTVRNPWYSQNGDGIDVESCKNVLVENSNFDVGDDAICIKSGKDEDGRKRGIPCENLVIRNNIVYHGHGGVTVGSEMSGGVKNMHVSNCTFMGTDVGLRFKSNRGRGGVVENIFVSNVWMTDIPTNAISFNLYYGGQSISEMLASGGPTKNSEKVPVSEETPQFKNISISNVTVKGADQAVFLQGLPEMNLENVELKNLKLQAENGFAIIDANGIKISNISLITKNENAFEMINCKNVEIKEIEGNINSEAAVTITGSESENISLISSSEVDFSKSTKVDNSVPSGAVKL